MVQLIRITLILGFIQGLLAANGPAPVLVLVDGFSQYLGEYCKSYCKERGIYVKEVVSPYLCGIFKSQGRSVPEHLRAPELGEEGDWSRLSKLGGSEDIFVVSESESGISTAERLQNSLGLCGNGPMPQLRNKYLQNVRAKVAGLPTVEQTLAKSWETGSAFLTELWSRKRDARCIIKPCRGVASDGVHCCEGLAEAETAFRKLLGKPQYGGGTNKAVLIQEYVEGPEYAVDTVTRDGETKVVAVWKYRKVATNGAPFVYQCTELVNSADPVVQEVSDYCVNVLRAQNLRWGPAHTEIRYTPEGPKLMEVNARWHAQNFVPIAKRCLGVDAVTATMDSFFDPAAFDALPARTPPLSQSHGMIVHLISRQEGIIKSLRHLDEIRSLPSVHLVDIPSAEGDVLLKTVDIRTDAGYVLLLHEDPAVLLADFERIVQLQDSLFEMVGEKEEAAAEEEEDRKSEVDVGGEVQDDLPLVREHIEEGEVVQVEVKMAAETIEMGAAPMTAAESAVLDAPTGCIDMVYVPDTDLQNVPAAATGTAQSLHKDIYDRPSSSDTQEERRLYQLQHPHLTPESIVRENIPFALAPVSKLGKLQHSGVVKKSLDLLKINAAILASFYTLSVIFVALAPHIARFVL